MTPPLFLVETIPAGTTAGALLILDGLEGRHAAKVRRLTVGEQLLAGDGRGTVAECVVEAIAGETLELRVRSIRHEAPRSPTLTVVQALPKGERAELAVEVLTELGVDRIVPWAASRSITQWSGARGAKALARWRITAREAAKQSRRPYVPEVTELAKTQAVRSLLGAAASALVLQEDAVTRLSAAALPDSGELVLVVGPEGGVSPDELDLFTAAGAIAVRLGPEVLRTSTAGAAAVAALAPRLGRW